MLEQIVTPAGVSFICMNGEAIIFGAEGNELYYFMYEIVDGKHTASLQKKNISQKESQSIEIKN